MIELLNIKKSDKMYGVLFDIVDTILSTEDEKYVEEISLSNDCIAPSGAVRENRIHIYVETSLEFKNHDLYDALNDLEEKYDNEFFFIGSVEPNVVERCSDVVPLYKK